MGDVIIVVKVLPSEPDNLQKVRKALERLKPKRLEEEPIGYGLSALIFTAIIPDEGGSQDKLEESIRGIDGVGEFEVIRASRSL